MRTILEQEGHVENRHLWLEGAEFGGTGQRHVHRTVDQTFDQLFLGAQRGRWENLDFDIALGFLLDELGKMIGTLAVGVGRFGNMPQLQHRGSQHR